MTPEAMKAAQKMIADAYDDGYITVTPVWVGQLDGCDVFALHRHVPVDKDANDPLYPLYEKAECPPLLGWPEYAFVDPKHPNEFVCKSDVFLGIARRLDEAKEKAKSKANKP
ncbi:MAG: hypothetical protein H9847_06725 [Candidatus Anaerobiospirillum pullicola]|uniref:Uncharacterized protein n=1 Tax=Candidatus Anaerobiospirillum pullicola TaxID=2838451 RepID=A0A948WZV5_9GAMM|nr:hypothetical protein [Candidatus Anaerobiospirillum pullicola]